MIYRIKNRARYWRVTMRNGVTKVESIFQEDTAGAAFPPLNRIVLTNPLPAAQSALLAKFQTMSETCPLAQGHFRFCRQTALDDPSEHWLLEWTESSIIGC